MIDGGCFAGRELESGLDFPIERTLAEFDRFGVAAGLVASYRSITQDLRQGAQEARHWAQQHPGRVVPVAAVHPAYHGTTFDALLGWFREELGIRIVAVLSAPAFYNVDWDAPAIRAIGQAAARREMILQAGIRDAGELGKVQRAWADLPVDVLVRWLGGHRYQTLASEIAVAAHHRRFRFDVGNMTSVGMIERAVEEIGADRLFLASNSPYHIAGCSHALLGSANLPRDAVEFIKSGTLRSLINMDRAISPPEGTFDPQLERLRARPKVDIHWHPDHNNLGDAGLQPERQLALFNKWSYERVVGFSNHALYFDIHDGNEATSRWCELDERLHALVVVDPTRADESIAQIRHFAEHPRFVGVKTIQDVHGMGLDDPSYGPILDAAASAGFPVLAHLRGLPEAARRYPHVTFIAAHANWGRAAHLAALTNVRFEFATGHALRHETQLAKFILEVGPDRVLFGSDGVLISPAWSLAKLIDASLSPDDEAAILRGNAYRTFPKLAER